jgi:hypothetical protein
MSAQLPTRFPTQRTEVRFVRPAGMKISWYAPGPGGRGGFTTTQVTAPGRYNFPQAAIYRLRLSDIERRPGMTLYPTLEVVPSNKWTDPFLAHSAVPVEFTNEDFDQVALGNYLVKVIYLPNPQFQEVAAVGGLEEIVSSRLEPGTDPILEAQRRGCILLVIRLGNIDLELENTPAMDAPNPYAHPPAMPGPGFGHGLPGPGPMVPYLMGSNGPMMGPNGPAMPPAAGGEMPARPGTLPNAVMNNPGLPPGTSPVMQPNQMPAPGAGNVVSPPK